MPASGVTLRGHQEVGIVDATPEDVPFGKTQQEGVTLQLATETVDLQSAQSQMVEDSGIVTANVSLLINMVDVALQTLQRLWGLPDSSFSGDLEGATPAEEVLAISANTLGSAEQILYSLGPGPVSTRRIEVARAKAADLTGLQQASNNYSLPGATWTALAPDSGAAVTITDGI